MERKEQPQMAELICNLAEQISEYGFDPEQLLQLDQIELLAAHNLLTVIKMWADNMLKEIEPRAEATAGMLGIDSIPEGKRAQYSEEMPYMPYIAGHYLSIKYMNPVKREIEVLRKAPIMVAEDTTK